MTFAKLVKSYLSAIYNHRENIWNKGKKWSKIVQKQKNLIKAFAWFFTAITKVIFLDERLGFRLFLHPTSIS